MTSRGLTRKEEYKWLSGKWVHWLSQTTRQSTDELTRILRMRIKDPGDKQTFTEDALEFSKRPRELFTMWFETYYRPVVQSPAPDAEEIPVLTENAYNTGAYTKAVRERVKKSTRLLPDRKGIAYHSKANRDHYVCILFPVLRGLLDLDNLCFVSDVACDVYLHGYSRKDGLKKPTVYISPEGVLSGTWRKGCQDKNYWIIKVCTRGHILVAIYSRYKHKLEWFDSSHRPGDMNQEIKQMIIVDVLQLIDRVENIKVYNVVPFNLQENEKELRKGSHGMCQTWIQWYIYQRFKAHNPLLAVEVRKMLEKMNSEQLADEISAFANKLVSLT